MRARLWWPNFVLSANTITSSAARIIACSVSTSSKLLLKQPRSVIPATLKNARCTVSSLQHLVGVGPQADAGALMDVAADQDQVVVAARRQQGGDRQANW